MKFRSFNLLIVLALLLSLLGSAVTVTPAFAAGILVDTNADSFDVGNGKDCTTVVIADLPGAGDGKISLREAICAANNTAGDDTITFAADYTITLNSSLGQLPAISSTLNITGNGTTKTIIEANVASNTATYRVFEIGFGGDLTLNNVTVRHGKCIGFGCTGGGIYNSGALTLTNSQVSSNYASAAGSGGGIYNSGVLTVTNSVISGNDGYHGGGIYHEGSMLSVSNSTISDNHATGNGGGMEINRNATLTNSVISGNKCDSGCGGGGGIMYNAGNLTITNSVLSDNDTGRGAGGAIFSLGSTLTITNSLISGNKAFDGGGIRGNVSLANSTISENSASIGGGMELYGTSTITNSTFFGNGSGGGGGIINQGDLRLANTIIAGSTGSDCVNNNTISINTNNLIQDGTCSPFKSGPPLLGPLTDNGGPTKTYALLSGSPAIDAGNASACSSSPVNSLDQRGVTRPQGAGCDIGAYETGPIIPIVTASNPSASAVLSSLSSITVVFNQDMLDNATADGAENINNYILVERGANGVFNTTSCNGGVVTDDVQQTIASANYSNAGFITTLNLLNPLTAGTYRLFVCGTTSVWSAAGLELNNGVSDYTVDFTIATATGTGTRTTTTTANTTASSLPKTGFAPNKVTTLSAQPATLEYAKLGDLVLEIPSLNVKSTIVGVPQNADNTWDVTWLGNNTGWLNGTAFPTWNGNSVLTAHVTNASGVDGPFAALKSLKYGDQIIVHLGGVMYVYEVRETKLARPYTTNYTFESKQDASYITLVTCSGYNPLNESYLFRRVVRAVLVSTISE